MPHRRGGWSCTRNSSSLRGTSGNPGATLGAWIAASRLHEEFSSGTGRSPPISTDLGGGLAGLRFTANCAGPRPSMLAAVRTPPLDRYRNDRATLYSAGRGHVGHATSARSTRSRRSRALVVRLASIRPLHHRADELHGQPRARNTSTSISCRADILIMAWSQRSCTQHRAGWPCWSPARLNQPRPGCGARRGARADRSASPRAVRLRLELRHCARLPVAEMRSHGPLGDIGLQGLPLRRPVGLVGVRPPPAPDPAGSATSERWPILDRCPRPAASPVWTWTARRAPAPALLRRLRDRECRARISSAATETGGLSDHNSGGTAAPAFGRPPWTRLQRPKLPAAACCALSLRHADSAIRRQARAASPHWRWSPPPPAGQRECGGVARAAGVAFGMRPRSAPAPAASMAPQQRLAAGTTVVVSPARCMGLASPSGLAEELQRPVEALQLRRGGAAGGEAGPACVPTRAGLRPGGGQWPGAGLITARRWRPSPMTRNTITLAGAEPGYRRRPERRPKRPCCRCSSTATSPPIAPAPSRWPHSARPRRRWRSPMR